jgi:hypothetical protein
MPDASIGSFRSFEADPMNRRLLSLLLVLFMASAQAQIIDNSKGLLVDGESYFNPDFIKRNKIKRIIGELAVKEEMQPIRSKGLINFYEFDEEGRLIEKLKTFKLRGGRIDTSAQTFAYNDLDQLVQESLFESSGYSSQKYQFDDSGRVVSQSYYRGENLSPFNYQLQKGKTMELKEERFSYEVIDSLTFKKIYYNSNGTAYKEGVIRYNRAGLKISERIRFYAIERYSEVDFQYDEYGRLEEINRKSRIYSTKSSSIRFEYDEYGNVVTEKRFENGDRVLNREFLYDVSTFLLKAELSKNEENNTIHIIKFRYEYY